MTLNFPEFYDYLEQEFRDSLAFDQSVHAMQKWLEKQMPHDDWNSINSLDNKGDLQIAKRWLPQVLRRAPSSITPKGVFFNILDIYGEEDDYGGFGPNHADLCPVLFDAYDADDESLQWVYGNDRFDIDNSNANLPALKEAGLRFNGSNGMGSEVYIAHSVGYVLMLLRHVLDGEHFLLLRANDSVGIVAGFGSGDLFSLGELTKTGLIVRSKPFINAVDA